jgi:hypothetical protein
MLRRADVQTELRRLAADAEDLAVLLGQGPDLPPSPLASAMVQVEKLRDGLTRLRGRLPASGNGQAEE